MRSHPFVFAAFVVFLLDVPLSAQAWQLPPRGVVFYQRDREAPRNGNDVGFHEVEMPPLLCEGELDKSRKFIALPPGDVRDLPAWLAFDLRIKKRKFTRSVHTIPGLGTVEITGKGSSMDSDGVQTIEATVKSSPAGRGGGMGGMRMGAQGQLSGTIELSRKFDRKRGLVISFKSTFRANLRSTGGGFRGPGRGRPGRGGRGGGGPDPAAGGGSAMTLRDHWMLDRVERNREPAFDARVAAAIRLGAEYVKNGIASGMIGQAGQNGLGVDYNSGSLALCLLTLLNADIDKDDRIVKRGFKRLRRRKLKDTYSLSVALMAMEALYAPPNERQNLIEGRIKAPAVRKPSEADMTLMKEWTAQLLKNFDIAQRPAYLLRFNYVENVARYDNSNTQYALLGLYSAHLCGVPISATNWFANAQHWLQDQQAENGVDVKLGTTSHAAYKKILAAQKAAAADAQKPGRRTVAVRRGRRTVAGRAVPAAGWPYVGSFSQPRGGTRAGGGGRGGRMGMPSTASMTTAGLTGVTICEAVLRGVKKGGALLGKLSTAKRRGLAWMLHEFSVRINKNNGRHFHYYLYGLERACEINQIALLGNRDWYFEGANILIETQNKGGQGGGGRRGFGGGMGRGGAGSFQGAGLPQTCMAILFLKQSAPPLPVITGGR